MYFILSVIEKRYLTLEVPDRHCHGSGNINSKIEKFYLLFLKFCIILTEHRAGVMELVDVVDSKSTGGDTVPVRARPPAPEKNPHLSTTSVGSFQ